MDNRYSYSQVVADSFLGSAFILWVDLWVGYMARQINKLSALSVTKAKMARLYPDGGNLYLQVTDTGAKSWLFRYMINGKARTMGLGSANALSLTDARERAADCRKLLSLNIDPIDARRADNMKTRLAAARSMTFKQCGEAYIEAHQTGWRNAKHLYQWNQSLSSYAYPIIGKLPVQDIDVAMVMKVLEPIWSKKTETANRLRGRIESILDWANVREYRQGENPARWRGRLQNLLPKPSKVQKVEHHPALPYDDMGDFMVALRGQHGTAAQALELLILTASRTSEVLNAEWKEFNLKDRTWTVPAHRIKTSKEHRVPLSEAAFRILKEMEKYKENEFVFNGLKGNKPLSNVAMLALLKRMKYTDITVHGFRSSFRDWVAEQTSYPREVAEAALSHALENKAEAAYQRGDLFKKRQQLMEAWSRYCYQPKVKATVTKIRG